MHFCNQLNLSTMLGHDGVGSLQPRPFIYTLHRPRAIHHQVKFLSGGVPIQLSISLGNRVAST